MEKINKKAPIPLSVGPGGLSLKEKSSSGNNLLRKAS